MESANPNAPQALRLCMLLLDHEARFIVGNVSKDEFASLFDQLQNEYFKKCTIDEQLLLVKHVLSIVARVISRSVSLDTCSISNKIHLVKCTSFTSTMLLALEWSVPFTQYLLTSGNQLLPIFKRLFHILVICIESTKRLLDKSATFALLADEEELIVQLLRIFKSLIVICRQCHVTEDLDPAGEAAEFIDRFKSQFPVGLVCVVTIDMLQSLLGGPVLAQIIHSCLQFALHPEKLIATVALECLHSLQCFVTNIDDWRNYTPGVFTGLHSICTSGSNRPSAVQSQALICLMQSIVRVGSDSLFPKQFGGECDRLPVGYSEGQVTDIAMQSFQALSKSLNRLRDGVSHQFDDGAESFPLSVAQWRIDFLQRIQCTFFHCYIEVYKGALVSQKLQITHHLYRMLTSCRKYLGIINFSQFVLLLLPGLEEANSDLRAKTLKYIKDIMNKEYHSKRWNSLCPILIHRWLKMVETMGRIAVINAGGESIAGPLPHLYSREDAKSDVDIGFDYEHTQLGDNEDRFCIVASMALNCVLLLGLHAAFTLRTLGDDFVRYLQVLCLPDITSAKKSIVLESRRFYVPSGSFSSTPKFVEGCYYRFPLLCTRVEENIVLCRRIVGSLCSNGLLVVVVSRAERVFGKLQRRCASKSSNDAEQKSIVKNFAALISLCQLLTIGVLAELELPSSEQLPQPKCAVCEVQQKSLSRCGRCKSVYYCCVEHQRQHWLTHKRDCQSKLTEQVEQERSNDETIEITALEVASTVADPFEVAISPQLALKKGSTLIRKLRSLSKVAYAPANSLATLQASCSLQQFAQQDPSGVVCLMRRIVSLCLLVWNWSLEAEAPALQQGEEGAASLEEGFACELLLSSALECVASVALALQKHFRDLLQEVIYPLLELSVVTSSIVKAAAKSSFARIAVYCGYADTIEALRDNIDYVVDAASAALRSATYAGATARSTHLVVALVFDSIGEQLSSKVATAAEKRVEFVAPIALMRDMIFDTLNSIDQSLHLRSASSKQPFAPVLNVLRVLVSRAMPLSEATDHMSEVGSAVDIVGAKQSRASIAVFRASLHILSGDTSEAGNVDTAEDGLNEEEDADSAATITPSVDEQLVLDVLERCMYFLSSSKLSEQMIVLDTISDGLKRLSCESRIAFPAIHKSWPFLMQLLKNIRSTFVEACESQSLLSNQWNSLTTEKAFTMESLRRMMRANSASFSGRETSRMGIDRLPLLPKLLDICSQLSFVGQEFFAVKFKEDLWRELLLVHLHVYYRESSNMTTFVDSGGSTSNTSGIINGSDGHAKGSLGSYDKIIVSLLLFWSSIMKSWESCKVIESSIVDVLCWLLIPLLGSHQSMEVHLLARKVLILIVSVPSCNTIVQMVCGACCDLRTSVNKRSLWLSLISLPNLVAACHLDNYWASYSSRALNQQRSMTSTATTDVNSTQSCQCVSIPHSDTLCRTYSCDKLFQKRIYDIVEVQSNGSRSRNCDINWGKNLERWQKL